MKNILTLVSTMALGLAVTSTHADAFTHTVALNATVQAACTANTPAGTSGWVVSGNSSTFTTAVSGTTPAPNSGTLTFGSLVCTTNNVKVTLTSQRNGLFVDGTQSTSGAKKMNYLATAKVNGSGAQTLDTSQGTFTTNVTRPIITGTNNVTVDITFSTDLNTLIPAGPLTAGTYSDTLTIGIEGAV